MSSFRQEPVKPFERLFRAFHRPVDADNLTSFLARLEQHPHRQRKITNGLGWLNVDRSQRRIGRDICAEGEGQSMRAFKNHGVALMFGHQFTALRKRQPRQNGASSRIGKGEKRIAEQIDRHL